MRSWRTALAAIGTVLGVTWLAPPTSAEVKLPEWLILGAEYRLQTVYIDPLDLSGTAVRDVLYTEQRARLDFGLAPIPEIKLITQFDLLDGALFGDNGDYGGDPQPTSGLAVTSRWQNAAGWEIGLAPGADPLDPDSYVPRLRSIDPIYINHIYGEINLPFGMLRIGRQPATMGASLSLHDGSRINRWGVSRYSYSADRILFATKISELFRMALEDDYKTDRSTDHGVFMALGVDLVVQDDIHYGGDDLHQVLGLLQWRHRSANWGGLQWKNILLQVAVAGRFGDEFNTELFGIPVSLHFEVDWFKFMGEFMVLFGHTREVSEGMQTLREADEAKRVIHDQEILAYGTRLVMDFKITGCLTATLEFDYASGDADPRDETPLTTFNFARDNNVGLLLFEHVLAFETARSAAVGIRNLAQVGALAFPLTELESEGRFHNAIALFPQVLWEPLPELHIRFGALFAWSAAPVTDSIMTVLAEDGVEIADDAVNWHGGRPARYYGTELDLQIEWRYQRYFAWTVEGAVLIPGPALEDESGDAVPSFLVENRFTVMF